MKNAGGLEQSWFMHAKAVTAAKKGRRAAGKNKIWQAWHPTCLTPYLLLLFMPF